MASGDFWLILVWVAGVSVIASNCKANVLLKKGTSPQLQVNILQLSMALNMHVIIGHTAIGAYALRLKFIPDANFRSCLKKDVVETS